MDTVDTEGVSYATHVSSAIRVDTEDASCTTHLDSDCIQSDNDDHDFEEKDELLSFSCPTGNSIRNTDIN